MSKKNKHIQIRVDDEERKLIEKLAKEQNLNLSEFIKFTIMKFISENEKLNEGMK